MALRSARILAAVVAAVGWPAVAADPAPKADKYGDPLPPGATARLGTDRATTNVSNRYRHCVVAADGRLFEPRKQKQFGWIDPATGEPAGETVSVEDRDGSGTAVAVTPDGKRGLFQWGRDPRVYDLTTGKQVTGVFRGTSAAQPLVSPIRVTPSLSADGTRVAFARDTAAGGATVNVWDIADGRRLAQVPMPDGQSTSAAALTPDGRTLLTRECDGNKWPSDQPESPVKAWDATTGQPLATFPRPGHYWIDYAFAADSSLVALHDWKSRVTRLHDPRTGELRAELAINHPIHYQMAFAPDGKSLVGLRLDDAAGLSWAIPAKPAADPVEPRVTPRPDGLPPGLRSVLGIGYSPDGPTVWAHWDNVALHAWNPLSRKMLSPSGIRSQGGVRSVAFTPDGRQLVTTDDRGYNIRWNVATGEPIGWITVGDDPNVRPSIRPSADAARGVSVRQVFDLTTGRKLADIPHTVPFHQQSRGYGVSDDGKRAVFVSRTEYMDLGSPGRCEVWDVDRVKRLAAFDLPPAVPGGNCNYDATLVGRGDRVLTVRSGYQDKDPIVGVAECWDTATGRAVCRRDLTGHSPRIGAAPDGRTGYLSVDYRIESIDLTTGKTLHAFEQDGVWDSSPVFTPDGMRVVAVWRDQYQNLKGREVRICAWPTGKLLAVVPGMALAGYPMAISPDGKVLACATGSTVLLYDLPPAESDAGGGD